MERPIVKSLCRVTNLKKILIMIPNTNLRVGILTRREMVLFGVI